MSTNTSTNKVREKFKSILIVVLFLSTVLLSFFYYYTTVDSIRKSITNHLTPTASATEDVPDISTFIQPRNIQVNFGDDTYTLYNEKSSELWDEFLSIYIDFTKYDNLMVEEITPEQWKETMAVKSIQYVFNYNLPSSYFESLGASNYGQNNFFSGMSIIAFSMASEQSLFVKDADSKKYFRIVCEDKFCDLDSRIDSLKPTSKNQYYPVSMLLGTDNSTLFPYSTSISLPALAMVKDAKYSNETYENDLAESFFGKSLDFIRKINDDAGTSVYMYGYSQRMLTVNQDGSFVYQETASPSGVNISFEKALSLAIAFISTHGSWQDSDSKDLDESLEYVSCRNDGNNSVYKFMFAQNYNDYTIYETPSTNIIIEIVGEQVTYYHRSINLFSPYYDTTSYTQSSNSVPVDLLSQNYQGVAETLVKEGIFEESDLINEDLFDKVTESITLIDCGYFKWTSEAGNTFVPSWIISCSNVNFFFDLYSGKYLGYLNEGAR